MLKEKSLSPRQIEEFCILLKKYGLFQPEELYKVMCPFHGDVNPSMQISIPKGYWYCYGCGKSGTILELYKSFQELEGRHISDLVAWKEIKQICKAELGPDGKEREREGGTIGGIGVGVVGYSLNKISYKQSITEAKDFYYNLPEVNWFKPDTEEGFEAKSYMKHRGFNSKLLNKYGAKVSYNTNYPIVFPLLENGIFRGYVMRTFNKEIEAQRKYMYNRGFKRERTLAGEFKNPTVVLVEGYLDKLKATQLGIPFCSAILGWKVSTTQIQKLIRAKVKCIVCALDSDEAGNKGYRYLKRIGEQYGIKIVRLRYPKGIKDMGDLKPNTMQAERVLKQIANAGLEIGK